MSNPSEGVPRTLPNDMRQPLANRQRQRQSRDTAQQRAREGGWKPEEDDQPAFSERRNPEFEWAEKTLPDEHPGLVVSALIGLEVAGEKRTSGSVMARLERQGRTAAQRKANDEERGRR